MFQFKLKGRIGRIQPIKGEDAILRLSIVTEREIETVHDGSDNSWTKSEWLNVVSFDVALNRRILGALAVGHVATLEGRIEPRKRRVGEVTFDDPNFVLTRFEPGAPLKSAKPAKSQRAAA